MCFPGILTKFFRIPLSDCLYIEAVTQKTLNMAHVSSHTAYLLKNIADENCYKYGEPFILPHFNEFVPGGKKCQFSENFAYVLN